MKKVVLITGAGGMLAQKLAKSLNNDAFEVRFLSRNPKKKQQFAWDIQQGSIDMRVFENLTHIVHLAGASVGEKRWTAARKKEIMDSRVASAKLLLRGVQESGIKLEQYVTASGISIYGIDTKDKWVDEESPKGDGFLADVVEEWERVADEFNAYAQKVHKLRFGVMLESNSGMLAKLKPLFKLGMGSAVGSGKQYLPWVHASDAANAVLHSLLGDVPTGIYNIVSTDAITNNEFSAAFAKTMKKPYFLPPVPAFVLKAVLGEMSDMVLGGNRVSNLKSQRHGFRYEYDNIRKALENV